MVMEWLMEFIAATAPSSFKALSRVYDKLKSLKDEEAFRAISVLFMAQLVEQSSVINKKLDQANEALAVLLKRTER
ncbi:MAG: hypothetical protein QXR81_08940 [Candidatus Nezhaarchaeales archaeon]